MQKQKSGFTPALLIFLVLSQQIGWQGYGQVNRTVVDVVMGYISTNVSQHTGSSSYDVFNTAFSDELNRRWDPAWNVFTIVTSSSFDTVLYGYAFRNQWMWYNDYRVNGVVLAFVVWKDYNCQGWKTVGVNGASSGFAAFKNNISQLRELFFAEDNLWNGLKSYVDKMSSINTSGGFSVVGSQNRSDKIYGRICVKDNNYYYFSKDGGVYYPFYSPNAIPWGNILIFQTR